jgi:hypothetical protein
MTASRGVNYNQVQQSMGHWHTQIELSLRSSYNSKFWNHKETKVLYLINT